MCPSSPPDARRAGARRPTVSETKNPPQKSAPPAGKAITELKVSGHLMSFDAGLYCIFHPPGSTPQDPNTGLPGVRVSVAPGPAFRPEAVTISTFRDDGWLGGNNGAALVRVARGPAQVLVTIYQAPNTKAEAPKLQIMRLAEGVPAAQAAPQAAAPAPVAAPAPAIAAPAPALAAPQDSKPGAAAPAGPAEITAHVQTRGDVTASLSGWMGEPGSKNWIEGFSISPKAKITPAEIEYQAVLGRGWLSPWAEGGQFCGSRGMSLPILGLRARLRGDAAERLECVLSASFVDGTRLGPTSDGEPLQAESLAPLEAFHIDLVPRKAEEPAAAAKKAPAKTAAAPKTTKKK